jgi:DNA-binding transcriptional regulator LsrR (DeoR family)
MKASMTRTNMKRIKLTEQEIDTLQWMRRVAGATHARLARDYEISRSTVARIAAWQANP